MVSQIVLKTLLTLTALAQATPANASVTPASHGYAVAEVQALLGVLGYSAGAVTGRMNPQTLTALSLFVTTHPGTTSLTSRLSRAVTELGPEKTPTPAQTAALAADLALWPQFARKPVSEAWPAWAAAAGLPSPSAWVPENWLTLAHLSAVRVTRLHQWPYRAEAGDSWSRLAFAAQLPESGFSAANQVHGSTLWVGQPIHWTVSSPLKPATPPAQPAPASSVPATPAPTPPPSLPSTSGVYSNLRPVASLVWWNPNTAGVDRLLNAERHFHMAVDVSVTGQWAVTHPKLIYRLVQAGNELDIGGYSGANLDQLPAWGVTQELTWSNQVLRRLTGSPANYVIFPETPNAIVTTRAAQLNLTAMAANQVWWAPSPSRVAAWLTGHPNQILLLAGPYNQWWSLLDRLQTRHFVFETVAQIWAQQP